MKAFIEVLVKFDQYFLKISIKKIMAQKIKQNAINSYKDMI